jgi:chemotaxis protein CheC
MTAWYGADAAALLRTAAPEACAQAGRSLSRLAQVPVDVEETRVAAATWEDVRRRFAPAGAEMVGAAVGVEGQPSTAVTLVLEARAAAELVALLVGEPVPGGLDDDMALSALGEIANVVGTSFLNVLARSAGERLMPTPPSVVRGTPEEVERALLRRTGARGTVLVQATFRAREAAIDAALVLCT